MNNRLNRLPEKLIILIWKHYYKIILENMNDIYFIKNKKTNINLCNKDKSKDEYINWSEYYNNLNTGGMIFRNLSYKYIPIWLRNKGCYNYSGSKEIQKYMYDCWYKFEYWYIYDNDTDINNYHYIEYEDDNESGINLQNLFE